MLRRLEAMEPGWPELETRIREILRQMDACFEILVPRLGSTSPDAEPMDHKEMVTQAAVQQTISEAGLVNADYRLEIKVGPRPLGIVEETMANTVVFDTLRELYLQLATPETPLMRQLNDLYDVLIKAQDPDSDTKSSTNSSSPKAISKAYSKETFKETSRETRDGHLLERVGGLRTEIRVALDRCRTLNASFRFLSRGSDQSLFDA